MLSHRLLLPSAAIAAKRAVRDFLRALLGHVPGRIRANLATMHIAVGADHAGFKYKDEIVRILRDKGHEVLDYGTHDETPVDYPQYGYAVGEAVASGQAKRGVLVCGSSLGIAIAANKVPGVRACPVAELYSAELARRHNDCNVIVFSERLTGWEMVERMLDVYLETPFDGGRHAHRVAQLFEFTDEQRERTLKALERGEVADAQTPTNLIGSA